MFFFVEEEFVLYLDHLILHQPINHWDDFMMFRERAFDMENIFKRNLWDLLVISRECRMILLQLTQCSLFRANNTAVGCLNNGKEEVLV